MSNPFYRGPRIKKQLDAATIEYNSQPGSGRINRKAAIWAFAATLLLTFPGALGLILVFCASKAKTRGKEEKLIFYSNICSVLATVLGIAYVLYATLAAAV